jgi:hypothetical protein
MRVSHEGTCPDCNQYASDFASILQNIPGWNVSNGMFIGPGRRASTGIGITFATQSHPMAVALMGALRAAQIPFDVMQQIPAAALQQQGIDVEFAIMAKP